MQKNKNTLVGVNFVKALADKGYRIFDIDEARNLGVEFDIKPSYMKECLFILKNQGWIEMIKPGTYSLCSVLLAGQSISEYEIAMHMANPSTIAYWSALHYHQLTQQIPHKIFVLTVTDAKLPKKTVDKDREIIANNLHYNILSVKKEHFFGIQKVWVGPTRVNVTDLEKTLIDAISKPKYCGGFSEVIEAYKIALDKIDFNKTIEYAEKMGINIRRLGWMLEHIGAAPEIVTKIEKKYNGYIKLNASGLNRGKFDRKWGVRVNI